MFIYGNLKCDLIKKFETG
jgi:hypothetical protein